MYTDPDTWYRLDHVTGQRLMEGCVSTGRCGTQYAVWMAGKHPQGKQSEGGNEGVGSMSAVWRPKQWALAAEEFVE